MFHYPRISTPCQSRSDRLERFLSTTRPITVSVNIHTNKPMLKKIVLGAMALAIALPATPAFARRSADDSHSSVSAANVTVTKERAIAIAQAKLAGTVRKAKLEREHGKATWKVRIISTDGLQRGDFRIDATTGAVLREKIKNIRGNKRGSSLLKKLGLKKHESEHDDNDDHKGRGRGRGSDDN